LVEGWAREQPEAVCLQALDAALGWIARLQKAFEELRAAAGKAKLAVPAAPPLPAVPDAVAAALGAALAIACKAERRAALAQAQAAWLATVPADQQAAAARAFEECKWHAVRERILADGARLDGRGTAAIRPITCEVGWLPRPHGSAIFTRGETQALVTCTLGTDDDAQSVDGLGGLEKERFLLHYNFPPYSVNELRPLRGPGRREIGHGELARRGLRSVLPAFADFPYTVRLESEISESNGSSSMATVCGGTLALLHAGVPLKAPVAGIAMGLVTDGQRVAVLSDILGDEDHLGDMDFKVVGTEAGVTALQLDNKVGGLSAQTLAAALEQARAGRLHVLACMQETLAAHAGELSRHAPRVLREPILPEAIGALVGARGANVKAIQAETKARVTIDDDGVVLIYAERAAAAAAALRAVRRCAGVVKAGGYYRGVVTGVKDFGAFVRLNPLYEGLVPAGDFAQAPSEGAELVVRVLGADERGRLKLSAREAADVDPALIEF
jgi:polyribonucleotide nucleotidyltransferase